VAPSDNGYNQLIKALVLIAAGACALGAAVTTHGTAGRPAANGLVAYEVRFAVPGVSGSRSSICVKDVRSGRTWRLPGNPNLDDGEPAWSPGGERLAFSRHNFRIGKSVIAVMDATGATRVVPGGNGPEWAPSWSPDGKRLVFLSRGGVFVMTAEGTERKRIVELPPNTPEALFARPRWSPDGSTISYAEGNPVAIFFVKPDGTGSRKFIDGHELAWAFDGNRVAYGTDPVKYGEAGQVHAIDLDGTDRRRLTNNRAGAGRPAWSPDGTQIAYARYRADIIRTDADLHVMDADGSRDRVLSTIPFPEVDPAWQPLPDGSQPFKFLERRPPCALTGTKRSDRLRGTSRDDLIYGFAGADRLSGWHGADRLGGGPGSDRILGGAGNDVIASGAGVDVVNCGSGRDTVIAAVRDRVAGDCERVRRR
jgi:Tol biopolymer transport system component